VTVARFTDFLAPVGNAISGYGEAQAEAAAGKLKLQQDEETRRETLMDRLERLKTDRLRQQKLFEELNPDIGRRARQKIADSHSEWSQDVKSMFVETGNMPTGFGSTSKPVTPKPDLEQWIETMTKVLGRRPTEHEILRKAGALPVDETRSPGGSDPKRSERAKAIPEMKKQFPGWTNEQWAAFEWGGMSAALNAGKPKPPQKMFAFQADAQAVQTSDQVLDIASQIRPVIETIKKGYKEFSPGIMDRMFGPGGITAALNSKYANFWYQHGIDPSVDLDDMREKYIQLAGVLRILGARRLTPGLRPSQVIWQQAGMHMPQEGDSPELALRKLNNIEPLIRKGRDEALRVNHIDPAKWETEMRFGPTDTQTDIPDEPSTEKPSRFFKPSPEPE
jgi:hypothetical protein